MESKKNTINYLFLLILAFLVTLQVFLLNKHSTMGDDLTVLNKNIDEIEAENSNLSQKIASLSAMTTIGEEAKQYGLASSVQVLSLTSALPLASNLKLSL